MPGPALARQSVLGEQIEKFFKKNKKLERVHREAQHTGIYSWPHKTNKKQNKISRRSHLMENAGEKKSLNG